MTSDPLKLYWEPARSISVLFVGVDATAWVMFWYGAPGEPSPATAAAASANLTVMGAIRDISSWLRGNGAVSKVYQPLLSPPQPRFMWKSRLGSPDLS